jgi:hypothetical protein
VLVHVAPGLALDPVTWLLPRAFADVQDQVNVRQALLCRFDIACAVVILINADVVRPYLPVGLSHHPVRAGPLSRVLEDPGDSSVVQGQFCWEAISHRWRWVPLWLSLKLSR